MQQPTFPCTKPGSIAAVYNFESATQWDFEPVENWHVRIFGLFRHAYPLRARPDTSPILIRRFCLGMGEARIGRKMADTLPPSFKYALGRAMYDIAEAGYVNGRHFSAIFRRPVRRLPEALKAINTLKTRSWTDEERKKGHNIPKARPPPLPDWIKLKK